MQLRTLFLSVVVLFVLLGRQSVLAQEPTYAGIDIVFLVDQSGSMGRLDGSAAPNDPQNLRFYAPWYAMYWMGEDRLLVHPEVSFRMAVVNFGTTAESWNFGADPSNPQYWQEISPRTRAEWEPIYGALTEDIRVRMQDRYTAESLGETNFVAAFQAAATLFAQLPETTEVRQRVVVVLTDGQPYLSSFNDPTFTLSNHLAQVSGIVSGQMPEPDYRLYVVGMLSSDSYWTDVRDVWEGLSHDPCTEQACPDPKEDRASLVRDNNEVGKRFQEILQSLTKRLSTPAGVIVIDQAVLPGPLVVPPYLKSLTFTYFKTDPTQHLALNDGVGPVDPTRAAVTIEGQGGPIEALRVANPQPGEWFVATDPPGVDVDISMRQIFAQSRLASPAGEQIQFVPVRVRYSLLDDLGQPLPEYADSRYRLVVSATIEAGEQAWPISLERQPGGEYQANFTPVVTGPHRILVHAESQDLSGLPVVVFDGEIGQFDVTPLTVTAINAPTSWPQYQALPMTFTLQDDRGLPVRLPTSVVVTATVSGESGGPLVLRADPDGSFRVDYVPNETGPHVVHVVATVLDNLGVSFTVTDGDAFQFNVTPTVLVGVHVLAPQSGPQENSDLFFAQTPFALEVQIETTDGTPLDPAQVFASDPAQALQITLTDQANQDRSQILNLKSMGSSGLYRAETHELGLGDYTLQVATVGTLRPGYVYGRPSDPIQVSRVWNVWHFPLLIVALSVLAATSLTVVFVQRKRTRDRQHPCRGKLYIVDAFGNRVFYQDLTSQQRNRIVFKAQDINQMTHLRELGATCHSDGDSQLGVVCVTIWLDADKAPMTREHRMLPLSELKLGPYNFWLLKDPDVDQLAQDRSGGLT